MTPAPTTAAAGRLEEAALTDLPLLLPLLLLLLLTTTQPSRRLVAAEVPGWGQGARCKYTEEEEEEEEEEAAVDVMAFLRRC